MASFPWNSRRQASKTAISFRYPSYSSLREGGSSSTQGSMRGPSGEDDDEVDDADGSEEDEYSPSETEADARPFLPRASSARGSPVKSKSKRIKMNLMSPRDTKGLEEAHEATGEVEEDDESKADSPRWTLDGLFDPERSAAENKSVLVSAELDRMGMGRYQWFIFGLCGLGYFIDLLWAQAWGLIATPIKNEFEGVGNANIGLLITAFNVGLTAGAFTWGFMVDWIGRKYSFYLTCFCASLFGAGAGGAASYATLCGLGAFVGFGVGGNIPVDTLITLEFLPTNRRFLLALLSIFQPLGVLVCCGIAYAFIPAYSCGLSPEGVPITLPSPCSRSENMGWRYTLYVLGALTLGAFLCRFFVFKFHESPAFLIAKGQDEHAIAVVGKIARFNGAPDPLFSMADFHEIDRRIGRPAPRRRRSSLANLELSTRLRRALNKLGNIRLLFSTRTAARCTLVIWLVFVADFFAFSLTGFFLPQILADKGAQQSLPLSRTYLDYVPVYAPGVIAVLIAACMVEVPRVGRQWAMVGSSAAMGISLFFYSKVDSQTGFVALNALVYFFQSIFNAILYAFVPEVYPSTVRGTGSGLASTWGRLASIVAPLVGQGLFGGGDGVNGVLYLAGAVVLVCPVALALLPYDTTGMMTY